MDLRKNVINKLNIEFGKDVKNISKSHELYKKLQEEKTAIEKSLSLASSEVPSKVSAAIKGVEDTNIEINKLTAKFDVLNVAVRSQLMKVEGTASQLQDHIDKIDNLKRILAYLRCVKAIEDIREFDMVLKAIKWPFVNNVLATPPPDALHRFQLLTEFLLQLQLPEDLLPQAVVTSALLTDFAPVCLPISLLIRPLRKRFLFHFYGAKQTNRPDKPEWFFTQTLTWIRDHEKFVSQWVQPVLNRNNLHPVSAKLEMMRGLVQLVVEKLHSELPHLQYDDTLFSHTVDETLGFDRELRDSFGYPASQPSVIGVLTQAQIFVKWIHMEKKYAGEKMDAMLSSDTAWLPLSTPELDELRVTECGESFLTLLLTITERYSSLPQPGHRLQFLELQLELLDDFRVRLLQLLHEEPTDPLNSLLPAILNTISYLASVLQEWGGLTHFLQLQYYKVQFDSAGGHGDAGQKANSTEMEGLQGTVFDDVLGLLLHMKDELINTLCEAVMMDVMARSREYRKDKWFAMPSPKELVNPTVTPSVCLMFQVLAERLHQLQELLSVPLFSTAWQTLAQHLNQFVYEEVILQNNFNEGGAMQLQYDMTRNMFPLFGQFTRKPDVHFPQVKESCVLLNLPKGSAHLLRDTLRSCLVDGGVEGLQEEDVLAEIGVHRLDAEKAITILNLRTDLTHLLA
ncbi:RAD50-interacting protein 1 isoform X2 [Periplaneta americana]|uniref:RAD50-interacting protein 1 isoform X2 n=1 Tax=Periplaneta americana TaxID=6978 RepID=UPI0037E85271